MDRYRTTYPEDDPSIVDGDNSLVGVDYYDTNENIPPGLCQAATNVDFTTQDAVTRGGFVCLPELGAAPFGALSAWTAETSAADVNWTDIAWGNNTFVAISLAAGANDVMVSADGVTWTAITSGIANQWRGITYANGMFVVVGQTGSGNRVMTSPDGRTWTARASASNLSWRSVTYGAGLFVAVCDNTGAGSQQVMTSPDGITWTLRNTPATGPYNWVDVAFGAWTPIGGSAIQLFIAISVTAVATNVMYSTDAITWLPASTGSADIPRSISFGQGIFVVVSDTGSSVCFTSSDGITWTSRSVPLSLATSVGFGSGIFAAVNGTGQVMTSPNGVTWTQQVAANMNAWQAVTAGNGLFVAVSNTGTGNRVMISNANNSVWASGQYSDPNDTSQPWIVLAGSTKAGFFSFGQTSRMVSYPAGFVINEQSCIVQANNFLFIFGGTDKTPIYWDGSWGGSFIVVPASTLGVGFMDIPMSNSALYYQNRLWVVDGKDVYAASQSLDFQNFNDLTDVFNLNVGTSDFLVTSYPFGNNSIVVFKNHSSYLLQNVSGDLTDVTSTEITRQLGIVGINAVTAVGPDIVYVSSDRNITSVRLNIQNATQAITVPLSRNINPLMARVNWAYGYKISVGYWNNLLFVAMPFDNATVCNTVLVYNFITNQWYGEWNFDSSINIAIQGWVTANYLGQIRMHAITEDGRIFVVNEGQNDISGTTVSEIGFSMTTRAYQMNGDNRFNRRMWADLQTNRPNFSIRGYVDGVNEYSDLITSQTYLRTQSWLYPTPNYSADNSSDDYNQAFRKDYSTGPNSIQCGTGFLPEAEQEYRLPLIFRRNGRLVWYRVTNTTGRMTVNGIGGEARAGYRSSLVEVG